MRPYLPPLVRSLAPTIGKLIPARSGGVLAIGDRIDNEGQTDRGNPYANGGGRHPLAGMDYGAIVQVHNHDAFGAPLIPRPSMNVAYVTPPQLWNLSGIAAGWSRPGQATPSRQPTAKLAFGRLGSLLAAGGIGVMPPLPTLPEQQRMVQPQL